MNHVAIVLALIAGILVLEIIEFHLVDRLKISVHWKNFITDIFRIICSLAYIGYGMIQHDIPLLILGIVIIVLLAIRRSIVTMQQRRRQAMIDAYHPLPTP